MGATTTIDEVIDEEDEKSVIHRGQKNGWVQCSGRLIQRQVE